jgi:hypothetical protein
VADKYGIKHVATDLAESLALPEVDAVILCTPTQMHAEQAIACMKAGKHVQVEIPLADALKDAQEVAELQKQTGLVAMWATPAASTPATSGCTRRSQPASSTSSRWMCRPTSSAAPT